jgi:hypothetical protein
MIEIVARYIPPSIKANKICRRLYGAFIACISFSPKKYLYYTYNRHRLRRFKDIHKGQRCFIIGTGPSLNKTNLSLIKDEIIFGVNTLYTGLSKFGITCNYYFVGDGIVWQNHHKNIEKLDTILFIGIWPAEIRLSKVKVIQIFRKKEPFVIKEIEPMLAAGRFSKDLSKGAYGGRNVIATMCTQAAYYMGFNEVYLLGVDCDYSGLHRFDGCITDNLEGDGVKCEWSKTFASYRICREAFEEDGREIINCTVGGKLEVFKRRKLEEVILSKK